MTARNNKFVIINNVTYITIKTNVIFIYPNKENINDIDDTISNNPEIIPNSPKDANVEESLSLLTIFLGI